MLPDIPSQAQTTAAGRAVGLALIAAYVCFIAAEAPFAARQGPEIPQLVSLFTSGIVIAELATAFLLLRATPFGRTPATVLLGVAYLYSALMGVVHLATFPGAIVGTAPWLGTPALTAPLFNAWRDGFAVLVLGAVVALPARHPQRASTVVLSLALALAGAVAAAWALSGLIDGPDSGALRFSRGSVFFSLLGATTGLAAIVILARRRGLRDALGLWLTLALVTFCGDLLISTLGGGRYTLGWFAGRTSGFVSACTLFVFFVLRFAARQQAAAAAALVAAKDVERGRQDALAELERANTLFETVINLTPDLVFVKDLESRAVLRNPAARFGRPWEEIDGHAEAAWHVDPEEARQVTENDRKVIEAGRSMQFVETFTTDKGVRTLLSTKTPWFDADGAIIGTIGVSTDITERDEKARQVEFITRELSHRSKNLLLIIQSIARQSIRQSADLADFEARFVARLGTLSRLHDLLVQQEWRGAELRDIALAELGVLASSQVAIDGPDFVVRPAAAQVLAMVFHELATNATKYGALSTRDGRIVLSWSIVRDGAEQVVIAWDEEGGPPVAPPARKGFGSIVIERTVTQIAGAEGVLSFAPGGVQWRFRAPAASLRDAAADQNADS